MTLDRLRLVSDADCHKTNICVLTFDSICQLYLVFHNFMSVNQKLAVCFGNNSALKTVIVQE